MMEELPEKDNALENCNAVTSENINISNHLEKTHTMEIHLPHGGGHERKLKDYLFEFFMLFLAITAGFFMENIRESYVENHKEHQYISSLIRDVQEDTLSIQNIIKDNEIQIKSIDSILTLLESPLSDSDISKLYGYTNKYLNNVNMFSVREVTINQLRNAGALRLIDNKSASDSIVYYYESYESHAEQQKYNYKILQELIDLEIRIYDLSAYRVKNRKMTFDASRTKEFYNRILMYNSMLRIEVEWAKAYQKKGIALLKQLKEEYSTEENSDLSKVH